MIKAIFNALFPKAAELSKMARELVAKELECTELSVLIGKLRIECNEKQYYINQLKFKIVCIEEPEEEDVIEAPEKPYRSKADVEIDKYLADKLINDIEQNGDE